MCGRPLIRSVFGLSLTKSVIVVGIVELVITAVATILNVLKYSQGWDRSECEKVDVCLGPLIKYSVFDALFGIVCALMLIFGAYSRSSCLLISWMVVTFFISIKYMWVVFTHDWTNLEDWISITYLLFYIVVYVIVWSLHREMRYTPVNGPVAVPFQQPSSSVVITQTFVPPQQQQYPQMNMQHQNQYPPQQQQQPYGQQYDQPPPYNTKY